METEQLLERLVTCFLVIGGELTWAFEDHSLDFIDPTLAKELMKWASARGIDMEWNR